MAGGEKKFRAHLNPPTMDVEIVMAKDVIQIMCPNLRCQRVLAVQGATRGLVIRCRGCSTRIRVPGVRDADITRNQLTDAKAKRDAA